jgi:hypothetical protein
MSTLTGRTLATGSARGLCRSFGESPRLFQVTSAIITIAVGLGGCSSPGNHADAPTLNENRQLIENEIKRPIPLPARTPFDNDPKAREAYLQSFLEGYRLSVEGWSLCQEDAPYRNVMVAGFMDGQTEGLGATPPLVKK